MKDLTPLFSPLPFVLVIKIDIYLNMCYILYGSMIIVCS